MKPSIQSNSAKCPLKTTVSYYCVKTYILLLKVGCPKTLDIWNPWGKVMQRSGLTFDNFD